MTTRSRIRPGDGDERHGTANGYCNLKCRCDECRKAWTEYFANWKARQIAVLSVDDLRHGRYTTYGNYNCRCELCVCAAAESRRYHQRVGAR